MSVTHDGIVDLSGDGGVLKKTLVHGSGEKPSKGCTIECHYVASLLDGTVFDSTRIREQTYEFELGGGKVLKGWEIGALSMQRGEKAVLTLKPEYAYGENTPDPDKIPVNATLSFEIELLDFDERADISEEKNKSLMKKRLLTVSEEAHKLPEQHFTVKIRYELVSADRTKVLDKEKTIEFGIGEGDVPKALETSVKTMRQGERARVDVALDHVKLLEAPKNDDHGFLKDLALITSPTSSSNGAAVTRLPPVDEEPPHDGVCASMHITILSVKPPPSAWTEGTTTQDKLNFSKQVKTRGNELFKKGRYAFAIDKYKAVFPYIEWTNTWDTKDAEEAFQIKVSCHLNVAMCELKQNHYAQAIEACEHALKLDENNVKALYRRATALMETHKWEECERDLRAALAVDPKNKSVRSAFQELKNRRKQQRKKELSTFGNMFDKMSDLEAEERRERMAKSLQARRQKENDEK